MSFSSELKKQIASVEVQSDGCNVAEAYAMLIFSRIPEGEKQALRTEQKCVADRAAELFAICFGVYIDIIESQASAKGRKLYSVVLPSEYRAEIMERFGLSENEPPTTIERTFITDSYTRDAFLRGAFLAAGRAADPDKEYMIEFASRSEALCEEIRELLLDLEINSGVTYRRGAWYVYIKERESIESLLAVLGAGNAYYEFVNLVIYRDMRNTVNRRTNFEHANFSKTVNAATDQIAAIKSIEESVGLLSLPQELRELARLRLENPEWTLRQLGEALNPPISRSGVNHRMNRLLELGKDSQKQK